MQHLSSIAAGPGPDPAGAGGPDRLFQARAVRRDRRLDGAGRRLLRTPAGRVLPGAAGPVRRGHEGAPPASRHHRHRAVERDRQHGRADLPRSPACGGGMRHRRHGHGLRDRPPRLPPRRGLEGGVGPGSEDPGRGPDGPLSGDRPGPASPDLLAGASRGPHRDDGRRHDRRLSARRRRPARRRPGPDLHRSGRAGRPGPRHRHAASDGGHGRHRRPVGRTGLGRPGHGPRLSPGRRRLRLRPPARGGRVGAVRRSLRSPGRASPDPGSDDRAAAADPRRGQGLGPGGRRRRGQRRTGGRRLDRRSHGSGGGSARLGR
uniref:Serine/threonine protein kinase n=1 Tax=Parastrongyloides trichosuri TaxID=131310 RepID=A0A0N5A6F1_PARTI